MIILTGTGKQISLFCCLFLYYADSWARSFDFLLLLSLLIVRSSPFPFTFLHITLFFPSHGRLVCSFHFTTFQRPSPVSPYPPWSPRLLLGCSTGYLHTAYSSSSTLPYELCFPQGDMPWTLPPHLSSYLSLVFYSFIRSMSIVYLWGLHHLSSNGASHSRTI
ncbi:hypothetical protein BDQ17DRAFT_368525 [Cyathus striatus]|nr:hypothetical protein BDQ17DRAFT_368525 [Cyathus striatus]